MNYRSDQLKEQYTTLQSKLFGKLYDQKHDKDYEKFCRQADVMDSLKMVDDLGGFGIEVQVSYTLSDGKTQVEQGYDLAVLSEKGLVLPRHVKEFSMKARVYLDVENFNKKKHSRIFLRYPGVEKYIFSDKVIIAKSEKELEEMRKNGTEAQKKELETANAFTFRSIKIFAKDFIKFVDEQELYADAIKKDKGIEQ